MIIRDLVSDSSNISEINQQDENYSKELRSAFAIYSVKLEIRKVLGKIKINQPNWKEILMYKVMLIINTHLDVEADLLKNGFNEIEYKTKMVSYLNGMNSANGLDYLKEFMSFTARYLSGLLEESMVNQFQLDSSYFNLLQMNLVNQEKEVYNAIQAYWYKALDEDRTYYYCYKSLAELYLNEQDFDRFIEINKKAISQGEFDSNTEFYLNIGNIYNKQSNFSEAIVYMKKAVCEMDENYTELYNYNAEKNHSRLMSLLNQKKQILRFIAKIYDTSGDQENAAKYQKLSNEI
jgi:tetratricopeptide (TPR) repeat protein